MFKKYFLAFVLVGSFAWSAPAVFAAADSSGNNIASNGEAVSVSNLGVENPGLLPTNPFYFIKEWSRGIRRIFTFNPVAKVKLELEITNQKAAEAQKVEEVSPNNVGAINKALENYQNSQERLKTKFEALKETSQNPEIEKLLNQAVDRAVKHEAVFNEIAGKFENQQEVKNLVDKTNEKIAETTAVIAAKDEPAKFISKVESALTENKSVETPNIRSVEIINSFIGKTSEGVKQSLEQLKQDYSSGIISVPPVKISATPTIKESVKTNIGIICTKEYNPVCGIDGNTYGNACEANASGVKVKYQGKCGEPEVKQEPAQLCPVLTQITPEVKEKCSANSGRIVSKANESGCVIAYECVYGNVEEKPTTAVPSTQAVPTVVSSGTVASDLSNVFVVIDENGKFIPQQIKVKKGGKVTWVNKGKFFVWPFSEEYPSLDSLRGISNGESYSAVLDKVGSWKYHDYLNSVNSGVIDVME